MRFSPRSGITLGLLNQDEPAPSIATGAAACTLRVGLIVAKSSRGTNNTLMVESDDPVQTTHPFSEGTDKMTWMASVW